MAMSGALPKDIDDYVDRFPRHVQRLLTQMRRTIQAAAPQARETISYRMPAFALDRMLVWFAAHTGHIGFYPGAGGIAAFRKDLSRYKSAKGSVQFPFDEPLPVALVRRIVTFRVNQGAGVKPTSGKAKQRSNKQRKKKP
jgi:uncharacterized protein YdhG (YjbR/CyaY superfamily)